MYVQYTAKDLLRKARAVALLKSVKAYPNGRFKYLDHVLIVDSEGWSALKIKFERTYNYQMGAGYAGLLIRSLKPCL